MEGSGLKQYKVIVLSIDDLVFNLNQIRYDFGNILYPKNFRNLSYMDFSKGFGTKKSIYSFMENWEEANDKIEGFLYSEKNYKNIEVIENSDELLKLLADQQKKIVAMTSHSYTLAKVLLKKRNLYQYIHQVLGLSEFSDKWPSLKVFNALLKYYEIEPDEMLVITSFSSVLECLNDTAIDTMYVGRPEKTYLSEYVKPTYTLPAVFDVIQFALFGKYSSPDLFNPILGFEENMKDEEKEERYQFLQEKYRDQPEILSIVDDAYYGNDFAHTTSYDTKEFRLAFAVLEEEKKEQEQKNNSENKEIEENEYVEEKKIEKKTQKPKKKGIFKRIFFDLLISAVLVGITVALHLYFYNRLGTNVKDIYDSTILAYPKIANYIFKPLTQSIGLTGRTAAVVHSYLFTSILFILIDFILDDVSKK